MLALPVRSLDPEGTGYIGAKELRVILKGSADETEIDKMIADAEPGENDGKISKMEFVKFVQTH